MPVVLLFLGFLILIGYPAIDARPDRALTTTKETSMLTPMVMIIVSLRARLRQPCATTTAA